MAVSREKLHEIFRDVAGEEFAHIPPEEEISYTFSTEFDEKMEKILKKQRKRYWNFVNTGAKKLVAACLLCLIFSSTACSVKVIRDYLESHKEPPAPEFTIDLKMVEWDEQNSPEEVEDHLKGNDHAVAIYGSHLDVEEVIETYFADENILKLKEDEPREKEELRWRAPTYFVKNLPTTIEGNFSDVKNTYAVVAANTGATIFLSYYSLVYEPELESEMDYYFDEMLNPEAIAEVAMDYARGIKQSAAGIVQGIWEVSATETFFDDYSTDGGFTKYIMKMYERTERHVVGQVSDSIEEWDFYEMGTYVTVTPGNLLTQQHPQYQDVIVVAASQIHYRFKSTEGDSSIEGFFGGNKTITEADAYEYKGNIGLATHHGMMTDPTNTVAKDYGSSYEWDTMADFYGGKEEGRHWNISGEPFTYAVRGYIRMKAPDFVMEVGTQIKTLFLNEGMADAKWTGRPMIAVFTTEEIEKINR